MTSTGQGDDDVFGADDRAVLARVDEGNAWLRAVLCTVARRGTLVRHREPERAAALIEALSPWPWFKGGQFLFDLMEWEDFMVDGPPPPLLGSVLGSSSVRRIAGVPSRISSRSSRKPMSSISSASSSTATRSAERSSAPRSR